MRFFSIQEIADSLRLQLVSAAVWFLYLFDLVLYSKSPHQYLNPDITNDLTCWAHFPQCHQYFHFAAFPFSYSYTEWMAVLLGFLLAALWAALKKKWCLAHFFLLIPVAWRIVFQFFLVDYHTVNFDLVYLAPAVILLFSKNKMQNLKYVWVLCYLFAARVKLDEGWILGTYFTSLRLGFPFLPKVLTPLVTNFSILFEMICSLSLLSPSHFIRRWALLAWTFFHLLSVVMVGYIFPFRCLVFLWILFGLPQIDELKSSSNFQSRPRSLSGVFIISLFCFMNFIPAMIPGDVNRTFNAIDYGLHMIDANHQCLNKVRLISATNQTLGEYSTGMRNPFGRCYPDSFLQHLQDHECKTLSTGERLEWKLWHSKNGGPFYETVNVSDACHLTYQAFSKSSWLKEPSKGAPIVGYPERNNIYKSGSPGSPPILQTSQGEPYTYDFLRENYDLIRKFYLALWVVIFIYLMTRCISFNFLCRTE